ncbi:META and DUF4377 domain-containing protein [Frateuria defendens]|uniref:META and DUF4377 domain-containing protein n=1 Tax=Frateuria defendens TaxID=2219559 RepID=UPI00066FE6CE|nr:META and DUF4377 domain-containing protein [Frateuria defendens]
MKPCLLVLPLLLAACASAPKADDAPPAPAAAATPASSTSPASTPTASTPAASTPAASDAATLGRYHWQLSEASGRDGKRLDALFARPDKPLQLDFERDHLAIANGCNTMGGGYRLAGGRLEISALIQTMMACADPALNRLDAAIRQYLHGRPQFNLQGDAQSPRLTLVTDGGDRLVFAGVPTPATRYGSEGETVFLEVAADTQPCRHPLMPSAQCLQVRERHYDDAQGLLTTASGPWHPLYQPIEGYTHEAGVRNVLRVKRYAIAHPPADAPSSAYVLDMVVESERVKH